MVWNFNVEFVTRFRVPDR